MSIVHCYLLNGLLICNPVSDGEARNLERNALVMTYQRMCIAEVPPLMRDKGEGGYIGLLRRCQREAEERARAPRPSSLNSPDQNGVHPR